jgi:hypothetical protein
MTKILCAALLALITTSFTAPAFAQKKQPAQKNQYTVPKEQQHWYDPGCANFNT